MNSEARTALKKILFSEGDFNKFPYRDSMGTLRIGYKRDLTDRGISLREAQILLEEDIDYFEEKLRKDFARYDDIDCVRQAILIDICFTLGVNKVIGFNKMIDALNCGNYDLASKELLNAGLSCDFDHKFVDLSNMMKTGIID